MSRARRVRCWGAALLLHAGLAAVCVGALAAQTRHAVLEERDGTAVGMSVLLQTGNAWESEGESGLSFLAAEAVAEQVRPRLHALGARVAVRCNASATEFTLLLPAGAWRAGASLFLDALFDRTLDEAAVERARATLRRQLATSNGDFTGELRRGLAEALHSDSRRWARDPCAVAGTLESARTADVQRWARTRFLATRATAAIAGPVDADAARRLLSRTFGESQLPLLVPAPPNPPSPGTLRLERNVVTTWVAVAFPFSRSADGEALELLAHLLGEATRPDIDRPEVYDAGTELRRHGDGGALVVYLITEPAHAARWAQRVRGLVADIGAEASAEHAFAQLLRRFHGQRMLRLATPEARAREAAYQLFFDGDYRDPRRRLDDLTPERIRQLAASLGQPAVVLLGPP